MLKFSKENNLSLNLRLLMTMKRIREVELRIAKEYSKQMIRCPVHLSVGQEAPSAALSLLINKSDFAVSTHRGHAHYLAKGGDLKAMICEIYGKKSGCSKGKGGSMHLIDTAVRFMGTSAIVGNSIPTGTGLAMAAKLNNKNEISIIHIGDGAIEEGAFYESLNFAAVRSLPALYLCENNFFSVYSPLSVRQPKKRSIIKMVEAIGVRAFKEDGNNVLETYQALKNAIKYVRTECKPILIELETFRWLEHCGPNEDDHLQYRDKKDISFWKNKDPIKLSEEKINEKERLIFTKFIDELNTELDNVFQYAINDQPPSEDSIFKDIFSEF